MGLGGREGVLAMELGCGTGEAEKRGSERMNK